MNAHPCTARNAPDARCRMLRPALRYASKGLPVFPCRANKQPGTPHGFHDAVTERERIVAWWTADPAALIGMPTGAASGIIAVDLDTDPAKGLDGPAAFAALVKTAGEPIRTRKHRTPRGGLHLLFTHPGEPVKNSASGIAAGVDTRGDGGYIILPPSKTEAGEYRIEGDTAPAPLPPWLCGLFRRHGIMAAPAVSKPIPPPPRTLPPGCPPSVQALVSAGAREGNRNDRALAVAVQLRDEGHDRATVEAHVLTFARNCNPPLPEREALAVVASAFNRPPREPARDPLRQSERRAPVFHVVTEPPREAPDPWEPPAPLGGLSEPPPPWPWDALPPSLRDMGRAIEETFNTSAEMAAAAVLGVASIALANKARCELKRDHRQFGNLFFLTVADVAAGKTPVMKAASAPLVAWQQDRRPDWDRACCDWEAGKAVAEARIRGLEDQAKKYAAGKIEDLDAEALQRDIARLKDQIGERPPEPILFCADATSEALGRRMQERGGAIGVLSGEARKILAIAKGVYKEGGDIELYLAGHGGDYVRVDRNAKDKPPYVIAEACLAAAIMTQPDSLQSLGACEALRESGFLARWLYLIPDHARGGYPVESIPPHVAEGYARAIRALVDLPLAVYEDGTPAPHLVRLWPAAFTQWRAFHDATQAEIGGDRETKPGSYLQWLSKLPEHVARLALLFHVCRHVEGEDLGQIGPEIEDAIRLAEALKVHARRAFALMGADTDTARARKVWTWLERNRDRLRELRGNEGLPSVEAVKPRDLDRATVAGVKNSADAEACLLLLADKGYVQAVDVRAPGAKPSRLFYLRPPDKPDFPDNGGAKSGLSGLSATPGAENAAADPDEVNRLLAEAADEDAAIEEGEIE
jgi:hypothetical protein